jgi:alcohol dehydrogenase
MVGTHGLQAHEYPGMLRLVERAGIDLDQLIGTRIGLADIPAALVAMDDPVAATAGVTVAELGSG